MHRLKVTQLVVQVNEFQGKSLIPVPPLPRNPTPYFWLVSTEETGILERLKPAPRRAGATCLTETRKDILQQIHDWVTDSQARNILWLRGSPGAGKTAVASSLVQS